MIDSPFNKKRFALNPKIKLSRRVMTRRTIEEKSQINITSLQPRENYPALVYDPQNPVVEVYHEAEIIAPVIEEPIVVSIEKKKRKKRG